MHNAIGVADPTIFQTAPIGWDEWLRILGAGLTGVLLVEFQKWLVNRKERRPSVHKISDVAS